MKKKRFYVVEITDPDPIHGGKVEKFPFAYRETAELWARDEVAAAAKLGIKGCTYRVSLR